VNELVVKLIDLWNLLELPPQTDFDRAVLEGNLGYSNEILSALQSRIRPLISEKEDRERKIREYGKKINILWDKLQVPTEEREEFFESASLTLGPTAIKSCKKELDRLELLFKESLKVLIEDARTRLTELWDKLHVSKEERLNFCAFTSEAYTEALLKAHEEIIEKNEKLLSSLEPILQLIQKREAFLKLKANFEKNTSDPKRLLSKGRDPGQLLREEKERKIFENKLPLIEEEIVRRLSDWEKASNKVFTYEGQSYLKMLQCHMESNSSKIKKRKPLAERAAQAAPATPSLRSQTKATFSRTPRPNVRAELNATFSHGNNTPARAVPTRLQAQKRIATPFVTKADKRHGGFQPSRPVLAPLQPSTPKMVTETPPSKRSRLSFD